MAAIQMFEDPRTVSGYQIELFETPGDSVISDDPLGRFELRNSLRELLPGLGDGARTPISGEIGRTTVLELQLTRDTASALIDNRLGLVRRDATQSTARVTMDTDPDRHELAFIRLADHPLVRSIQPPVQLQLVDCEVAVSDAELSGERIGSLTLPTPSAEATYPIIGIIDSGVAPVLDAWIVDRFDYLDETEHDTAHGTGVAGLVITGQAANSIRDGGMPESPPVPRSPFRQDDERDAEHRGCLSPDTSPSEGDPAFAAPPSSRDDAPVAIGSPPSGDRTVYRQGTGFMAPHRLSPIGGE